MRLVSKAALQIQKPVNEVFEAIVNPEHMTEYFISESTGRLDRGGAISWKFPEFPGSYPLTEIKLKPNHAISFVWDPETVVNITLKDMHGDSTVIEVVEGSKELNAKNLQWLSENSGGWANFLACLKAYLEYGVPLRKGAFEFMRK